MRIIGGILKGKSILPPANYQARPTTDFAKEGLFNVIENEYELEGYEFLDLFAGTGAISAEFVSRGAKGGVCVEMNRNNCSFIIKMFSSLKIKTVKCVHCNVFDFIELCNRQFDFIFADPPYSLNDLELLPDKIFSKTFVASDVQGNQKSILSDDGYFILEHPESFNFSSHTNFVKEKKYGNVHFSFFQHK